MKMLYSHLIVHKYIQITQNITKAENLSPFGILAFKRKKTINSIKMTPWNDCISKNNQQ